MDRSEQQTANSTEDSSEMRRKRWMEGWPLMLVKR